MHGSSTNRLQGVHAKLKRAKKHIADLNSKLRTFYETGPYAVGTKHDPKTGELIYYITRMEPLPQCVPLITADALQNLRSAIDHLAYQLWLTGTGGTGGPGKHVYFPIADDAAKYKTESPGKVKGMRQDAIDAISVIEPYKGGAGHQLWVLHKLNNIDKHRLLVTVWATLRSYNLGAFAIGMMQRNLNRLPEGHPMKGTVLPLSSAYFQPGDRRPLNEGDELWRDSPDAEVNKNMDFRIEVALSEPQIVEGDALLETLHKVAQFVDGVIGPLGTLV